MLRINFLKKHTRARTRCVILFTFTLHQWLHERVLILRYTYFACLVRSFGNHPKKLVSCFIFAEQRVCSHIVPVPLRSFHYPPDFSHQWLETSVAFSSADCQLSLRHQSTCQTQRYVRQALRWSSLAACAWKQCLAWMYCRKWSFIFTYSLGLPQCAAIGSLLSTLRYKINASRRGLCIWLQPFFRF
jgi:hypothetical protein